MRRLVGPEEEFVRWRREIDCDFLLDVWDLALGWFSGRGFSHDDAMEMANRMRARRWAEPECGEIPLP
jgi:hypothetical protein